MRIVLIVAAIASLGFATGWVVAQPKGVEMRSLRTAALGTLPGGRYSLQVNELIMQPGAEIPPHQHKNPGVRYVAEGAITITWKDGKSETYRAGSTYFEGPGENHPASTISAKNAVSNVSRIVIVELAQE
jgi:quercetin dioxygenase-like cupin family protein